MLPTTLLLGLVTATAVQAGVIRVDNEVQGELVSRAPELVKRWDDCKGAGRCCRCKWMNRYHNSQTKCVARLIGAERTGDNGGGLFFCGLKKSQDTIKRLCGNENRSCTIFRDFWGYDCWDC